MSNTGKIDLTKWPHEVVTTSHDAWHSRGVTGITVYPTKGLALRALGVSRARLTAGEGAFVRPAPSWEVSHEWIGADRPMLRVTVRGPSAPDRQFTVKAAARARQVARKEGPGVRATRVSSGASITDRGTRTEYRVVYVIGAGE